MNQPVDPEIVKLWLERLRANTPAERAEAASELTRMSIRTRGAVRTRGGLARAAPSTLPPEVGQAKLLKALGDESPSVRREVAFALSEWGDEQATTVLRGISLGSRRDPDEAVRRAAVTAIGTIGGLQAVETLCQLAETDPSDSVRYDAVTNLSELARKREAETAKRDVLLASLHRVADNDAREHIRRAAAMALKALVA